MSHRIESPQKQIKTRNFTHMDLKSRRKTKRNNQFHRKRNADVKEMISILFMICLLALLFSCLFVYGLNIH